MGGEGREQGREGRGKRRAREMGELLPLSACSKPLGALSASLQVPAGAEVSQDASTRAASASYSLLLESQRPASSPQAGFVESAADLVGGAGKFPYQG